MTDSWIARPTFIVGCVRSGTTLFRLMLDHHPGVSFWHEFEYAIDLVGDDGRFPDLGIFHDYLRGHRIFQDSGVGIDPALDFRSLVNSFLAQKRGRDGKPLVGATVHSHFDRLPWVWPDARYIHLVRDGRDVGRSMVEVGFVGNSYAAVEQWMGVEYLWSDLAPKIPPGRRIEVRYEDLVARPEATLTRVCEFLGVPYDPAMLDYPKDTTYGPPSPEFAERWRTMPHEEVEVLEARIGGMLIRRDYPLSGRPLRQITPAQHLRLMSRHRWARARLRMKRYGPPLYFGEVVTRRLRFDCLHRRLSGRIDRIDRRLLK